MNSKKWISIIDKYILGRASENELNWLEKQRTSNPELDEMMELLQAIPISAKIRMLKQKLQEFEAWENEIEKNLPVEGYFLKNMSLIKDQFPNSLTPNKNGTMITSENEKIFLVGVRRHMTKVHLKQMERFENTRKFFDLSPDVNKKRKLYRRIAAIAAVSLVLGIWFFAPSSEAVVFENFSKDFVLHEKTRSAKDVELEMETMHRGYNLYTIQEYKQAIPHLKKEWELHQDELSLFYLAVSYAAIGKDKKALKTKSLIRNQEHLNLLDQLLQE